MNAQLRAAAFVAFTFLSCCQYELFAAGCTSQLANGTLSGTATIGPGCTVTLPLWVFGNGTLVDGGRADSYVRLFENSSFQVAGGTVGSYVHLSDPSSLLVTKGIIDGYVLAEETSTVTLRGGFIDSYIKMDDSSVLKLYGSNFSYHPVLSGFGEFGQWFGQLTGVLQDGTHISYDLRLGLGAKVFANDVLFFVPEPSTIGLGAIAMVALTSASLRRRTQRQTRQ
jgi:hypothetical protein